MINTHYPVLSSRQSQEILLFLNLTAMNINKSEPTHLAYAKHQHQRLLHVVLASVDDTFIGRCGKQTDQGNNYQS